MGFIKARTARFDGGLLCLAALGFLAMVIVLLLSHDTALERAPEGKVRAAE